MKAKKGISLIVLVITIIVIIILAAAVLLTLNNNNPIKNAKEASYQSDCSEIKSALALYIGNFMANDYNHNGPFDITTTYGSLPTDSATAASSNWIVIGIKGETNCANSIALVAEDKTGNRPSPNDTLAYRTTKTTTTVSWADLGLTGNSEPKSIATALYNPVTGEFYFAARPGYDKNI